MKEAIIERRLKREVEKIHGLALKFTSPGWNGAPDRIVLLPGGRIFFVEMKAPGKKARPLQEKRLQQLRDLGFDAQVIDSIEGVDCFVAQLSTPCS